MLSRKQAELVFEFLKKNRSEEALKNATSFILRFVQLSEEEVRALLVDLKDGKITLDEFLERVGLRGSPSSTEPTGSEPRAHNEELGQELSHDDGHSSDFLARGDEAPQTSTSYGDAEVEAKETVQEKNRRSRVVASTQPRDLIYDEQGKLSSSSYYSCIQLYHHTLRSPTSRVELATLLLSNLVQDLLHSRFVAKYRERNISKNSSLC